MRRSGGGKRGLLRAWLIQNGHWVYADPAKNAEDVRSRPLTHVFYDGGRAAVPPGPPRARFLEVYADALSLGEKPRVAEMTPPDAPFHAFADLDTKHRAAAEDDAALTTRMLEAFRRVGGQEFSRAVVCTKAQSPGGRGVHVMWLMTPTEEDDDYRPVLVTRDRMTRLREECVRELTKEDELPWGDIFDGAVYSRRQATLRMVFSRSKDGQDDHYVPTLLWTSAGGSSGITDAVADVHAWVRRCSILPVAEAPCRSCSCTDDDDDGEEVDARGGKKRRRRASSTTVKHHVAAPEMRERIEGLSTLLPEPYRKCGVTGVTEKDHVILLKLDSRYCHNVGREHTSSRVYLQIDRHGVGQRCFCCRDTTEGREFGRCADVNLPLCEHGAHPFSDLVDAKLEAVAEAAKEEEKMRENGKERRPTTSSSLSAQRRPATVLQAVDAMRERLRRQRTGGVDENVNKKSNKKKKNR